MYKRQAVGDEDAEPLRGHGRGHRREHRERCHQHHVVGDLEHHVGDLVGDRHELLAALAERRRRHAREDREHDDLQDLVVRHRLDDRFRDEVRDEFLQRQRRDLEIGRCARLRQRQAEVVAGPQDVDHHHADGERDQRSRDEPGHRLHADPADRLGVTHMSDADHQHREHQRRDDHLDQPQEQVGDDGEIARDAGRFFRVGNGRVENVAKHDTEDHSAQDPDREALRHGDHPPPWQRVSTGLQASLARRAASSDPHTGIGLAGDRAGDCQCRIDSRSCPRAYEPS